MPVWRMREEISNEEYVYWSIYYARKAQRRQLADRMARTPKRG